MKKLLLLPLILLFLSFAAQAQWGISAGWVQHNAPEFDKRIESMQLLIDNSPRFDQSSIQIGLDYWFRLKQKRIEFLPELSFYQLTANLESISYPDFGFTSELKANVFQLHFNSQIYIFDFAGDCDCPTFSKDGDLFKKGLFIRLSPGLSIANFEEDQARTTVAGLDNEKVKSTDIAPTLRAGVGLDIGLSDFITITPLIQYTHTFSTDGFASIIEENSDDLIQSEITQLYFGLRFGFRFDELNKYGYR